MKLKFIVLFSVCSTLLFSENIYLFARSTFAVSHFWAGFLSNDKSFNWWDMDVFSDTTPANRKFFSNFLTGSAGSGMEMIIWDNGKDRGSRIYFKGGLDWAFSGPTYMGYFNYNPEEIVNKDTIKDIDIKKSLFYMGFSMDIFIGGTFPKTDLFWGIGAIFNFMFPVGSSSFSVSSWNNYDKFAFYVTPALSIGYDIFIPYTSFKITPQIRTGITCMPILPRAMLGDAASGYYMKELYSGFFVDMSVAFSFKAFRWKK